MVCERGPRNWCGPRRIRASDCAKLPRLVRAAVGVKKEKKTSWMVLAVLAPLVGLLVLSTVSVYLQPRFIVNLIARSYPEVVFSINTTEKIIALTIDDAPTRLDTPIILDILRENNVRATFFCIGYNIITEDSDREILARMYREGHELGNHMSFDAPSYQLNDTEFSKQFHEVHELLQEVKNITLPPDDTNNSSMWFRPGHGFFTRKMVEKVQSFGYKTALGDIYPHDPAIAISSVNSFCIFTSPFVHYQHPPNH